MALPSSSPLKKAGPVQLRLRITATAESLVRSGHPWLFAQSVRQQNRPGQLGELAVLFDHRDRFLAVGLFDPDSPIRVRILHVGKPQIIDSAWWTARLTQALALRQGLWDDQNTALRCLNGESDGWPGLVVDRYAQTLVLKLYTAIWLPRLQEVLNLLQASPVFDQRVVLRTSRNLQSLAQSQFSKSDGQVLLGPPLNGPVVFQESGLNFEADLIHGQKTGFFLDQRENRRRVEPLAAGQRVLNAFSFSGGFSLYAARGGASAVTDLDLSRHALQNAERNFALNQQNAPVAACRHECVQADAFEWLAQPPKRLFGLVVLDPPSLAKREIERSGAISAYNRLASMGLTHLAPGGTLLACSCSAHVSDTEFFEAVRAAATRSRRPWRQLATAAHAPDHPATFKEAHYLKAIYLKFEP